VDNTFRIAMAERPERLRHRIHHDDEPTDDETLDDHERPPLP
jgi:hypothetical protein